MNKYHDFLTLEKKRLPTFSPQALIWALFSRIGSVLSPPAPNTAYDYLNLGCGSHRIKGFINADFFRYHEIFDPSKRPDWMLDLSRPLNCPNNRWRGIFLQHVLEHLTYTDAYNLLSEIFRTLQPNGSVRIILPDLDAYLSWPELSKSNIKMSRYKSFPEAICNLSQLHGHRSTWNFSLLTEVLLEIGFTDIKRCCLYSGTDPILCVDDPSHEWQSLYLEARKYSS